MGLSFFICKKKRGVWWSWGSLPTLTVSESFLQGQSLRVSRWQPKGSPSKLRWINTIMRYEWRRRFQIACTLSKNHWDKMPQTMLYRGVGGDLKGTDLGPQTRMLLWCQEEDILRKTRFPWASNIMCWLAHDLMLLSQRSTFWFVSKSKLCVLSQERMEITYKGNKKPSSSVNRKGKAFSAVFLRMYKDWEYGLHPLTLPHWQEQLLQTWGRSPLRSTLPYNCPHYPFSLPTSPGTTSRKNDHRITPLLLIHTPRCTSQRMWWG